jgi:peptidoglycan/LPS O-acetylase OafA/YrhL
MPEADTAIRSRTAALALLADVVCVLFFCAIGRRSHAEGLTVEGVLTTAWPFLTGTAIAWLSPTTWRRPTSLAPTGLLVWVCTVAVGMLMRRLSGQGTALSFVIVASVTTAILVLGWRAGATLRSRR